IVVMARSCPHASARPAPLVRHRREAVRSAPAERPAVLPPAGPLERSECDHAGWAAVPHHRASTETLRPTTPSAALRTGDDRRSTTDDDSPAHPARLAPRRPA